MNDKVRSVLNEFENYNYYKEKLHFISEQLALVEWDMYYSVSSPMKTEDYLTYEKGKLVKRSTFKQRVHDPHGAEKRRESLERERDVLDKRKVALEAQIEAVERNLSLLSPEVRAIVNVAYIERKTLEQTAKEFEGYTANGLYLKVMREMEKKKELFV